MSAKKQTQNEPLVDYQTIASETGLTISFIRKAQEHYKFPFYKIGGSVKFKISEVMKWIEDRKVG
jgi:excisionase family DNA binding protein